MNHGRQTTDQEPRLEHKVLQKQPRVRRGPHAELGPGEVGTQAVAVGKEQKGDLFFRHLEVEGRDRGREPPVVPDELHALSFFHEPAQGIRKRRPARRLLRREKRLSHALAKP